MPRPNKLDARGLYRGSDGRFRIDLRWRDAGTGSARRHKETLPRGTTYQCARERATKIFNGALAGEFTKEPYSEARSVTTDDTTIDATVPLVHGRVFVHNHVLMADNQAHQEWFGRILKTALLDGPARKRRPKERAPKSGSPFVTVEEAARVLPENIRSISTVRWWLRDGGLPSRKIGRHRLILRTDLAKFLGLKTEELPA